MARGIKLSSDAREIIYRVYLYFTLEAEKFETEEGYFQKVRYRVAKATGVSKKSIYRLVNEKGKPGSETFQTTLEALKRSRENYESQDEEAEESAPKILKIHDQCQTTVEEEITPKLNHNLILKKTEPPIIKIYSNEVNIQTKENPSSVTHKKQYVKTTTVYTTQSGPEIAKVHNIQKNFDIKEASIELKPETPFVTFIKALPSQNKTKKVSQHQPTPKTKTAPEVVLVKAQNSQQNIAHKPGPTFSTVPRKPERTIIKVHRIRLNNAEIQTTTESQNKILKPIETPDFIKLEAQIKSEEMDPLMVANDIKVEIKNEINDNDSY